MCLRVIEYRYVYYILIKKWIHIKISVLITRHDSYLIMITTSRASVPNSNHLITKIWSITNPCWSIVIIYALVSLKNLNKNQYTKQRQLVMKYLRLQNNFSINLHMLMNFSGNFMISTTMRINT